MASSTKIKLFLVAGFSDFLYGFGSFKLGSSSGAFLEFVYDTGGVNKLLFASIKRMAGAADLGVDLRGAGAGGKGIAASAGNNCVWVILWVDVGFHSVIIRGLARFVKSWYNLLALLTNISPAVSSLIRAAEIEEQGHNTNERH